MSRIEARFEALRQQGEGALIVFVVAGHPSPGAMPAVLEAVAEAGADIIELGIPFSDPLADGATIQAASQQALAEGMTPAGVLRMASEFRARRDTPLVVMTCYNPVWQFGVARFAQHAAASGVDGVIVTDLPPEESREWVEAARAHGVDTVFLLSPTSGPTRVKKAVDLATGFVYCVSRMGVTGAREALPADLEEMVGRIRAQTDRPVAVGFGISRPEHVAQVCRVADGAVVGSAVVSRLAEAGDAAGLARGVGELVGRLKAATRGLRGVRLRRA